jgi:hypothetical protein
LDSAIALTLAIQLQLFGTGYRWLVLHSGCIQRAPAASPMNWQRRSIRFGIRAPELKM